MMPAEMMEILIFMGETNFIWTFSIVCDLHILFTFIRVISIFLNLMLMQIVLNIFKAANKMSNSAKKRFFFKQVKKLNKGNKRSQVSIIIMIIIV